MPTIRKVVFPVAGLGTRFLPATKTTPKEMLPVVDKPLIQYATDEAVEAGAQALVFITSRKKHAIFEHFDTAFELEARLQEKGNTKMLEAVRSTAPESVSRIYVPQPQALGLGHAVLCGRDAVGEEAFGVILADDMIHADSEGCLKQMARIHAETGHSVLAVEEVPREQTGRYGIVSTEPHGDRTERVVAIVEKPDPDVAPSNLAVVGRYILTPRIFDLLEDIRPGAGGEIQLTDAISRLLQEETVLCYRFRGKRYDCGSKLGFIQATVEYALRHEELADPCRQMLRELLSE